MTRSIPLVLALLAAACSGASDPGSGVEAGPIGEPLVVEGLDRPTALAVYGGRVYWIEEGAGSVRSCPTTGTCADAITTLADGLVAPKGLAVTDAGVFFTTGDRVLRCPLGGCGGSAGEDRMSGNYAVAADATTLVASRFPADLLSCPIAGCAPGTETELTHLMGIEAVAMNDATIYFSRLGTRLISRCSRLDCAATDETFLSPAAGVTQLALGDARLVWAESSYEVSGVDGRLLACPTSLCTEPEVLLATPDIAPYGVALDGGVLYWSDYAAGTIRRFRP